MRTLQGFARRSHPYNCSDSVLVASIVYLDTTRGQSRDGKGTFSEEEVMRSSHIVAVLSGILLRSCSAPSRADTLDAPVKVFADDTGAFSYDAVFTASTP